MQFCPLFICKLLLKCGYLIHSSQCVQSEGDDQQLSEVSHELQWVKAETIVVHMLNAVILVMHFQKVRLGEWQAFSALWETISTRGANAEWEARVGGLVLLAVNTAISFSGIHYENYIFSSPSVESLSGFCTALLCWGLLLVVTLVQTINRVVLNPSVEQQWL